MLVPRRSTSEIIEQFLDTEVFKQIHDLVRHEGVESTYAFSDLEFWDSGVVRRLASDPHGSFNLSAEEASRFSQIDRGANDAQQQASERFRAVLANRVTAYTESGLDGVADYARRNGESVSPAEEIRSGLQGMTALRDDFQTFFGGVGSPLNDGPAAAGERRLHWIEKIVNNEPVVALVDQDVANFANSGVAVELHYYASAIYNSMVTMVAAAPYGDQTLVFAINHTYTEQVTGLGASLRRRIARNLAADVLSKHLLAVRERVQEAP